MNAKVEARVKEKAGELRRRAERHFIIAGRAATSSERYRLGSPDRDHYQAKAIRNYREACSLFAGAHTAIRNGDTSDWYYDKWFQKYCAVWCPEAAGQADSGVEVQGLHGVQKEADL